MNRTRAWSVALALVVATPTAWAQGTVTAGFGAESTVLDPVKYSAGVDHYFMGQMFEQLVRVDPQQRVVNWLAESWKIEQVDGKPVIDVRIRKDVKFHNGDALTAADFEFTYNKLRDPKV